MSKRLAICYAAPGHALHSTSGTTRNMLSLAEALSQWADVTVAFRNIREPVASDKFKIIAIEPQAETSVDVKDDVAARGLNVFAHLSYLRRLSCFAKQSAGAYDLVLEKGWRLSGFLCAAFSRQGIPAALVENDIRHWSEPIQNAGAIARYGAHRAAQCLAGFYSRKVAAVIAETEELKATLTASRGLTPERIEVVQLGVNHDLFRPLDQASCRRELGIDLGTFVLLYVGGLDTYHDLGPLIDALAEAKVPSLELHVVGDGALRSHYETKSKRARVPIRFHGLVPHPRVPEFIATADLCLAPYRVAAFPNGAVSFSTLKIPEYMACGRPVASVPSGHIKNLVEDRVSGYLFPNDAAAWVNFIKALPARAKLGKMGCAAARAVESLTWDKTASRYLEVCQRLVGSKASVAERPVLASSRADD
jgi:glycosyltransferase involved in cell wall biosynthesis